MEPRACADVAQQFAWHANMVQFSLQCGTIHLVLVELYIELTWQGVGD